MTSESSLERRHADGWFSWAHDPRALMKVGLPLVLVAIGILWVVWNKRPEPPPQSLAELERVAGEVQSLAEDYRPLYRTKVGRKAVVHGAREGDGEMVQHFHGERGFFHQVSAGGARVRCGRNELRE